MDKTNNIFKTNNTTLLDTINNNKLIMKDRADEIARIARLTSYSKRYEQEIWDMIRPVYSKPFWNKEAE